MARYAGFRNAAKLAEATFLPKVNKYHAKKTVVDGITFDSKKEAARYKELKLLYQSEQISTLCIHVPYRLKVNGVLVCTYVADFVYFENGARVIEDCKGFRTKDYRLKKKLMKAIYGIEILET